MEQLLRAKNLKKQEKIISKPSQKTYISLKSSVNSNSRYIGHPTHLQQQQQHNFQKESSINNLSNSINQEYSLELVKDTISASFGALAFLRGFFSDENFEDDVVSPPNLKVTSQNDHPLKLIRNKPLNIKRLKRGITPEADTLIDWITIGAFDALEKGYLKNIIFSIFSNENDEADFIEAYSFSFVYSANKTVKMDFSFQNNKQPTVENISATYTEARVNSYNIITRVIQVVQNLNQLPKTRNLSMRFLYTKETPIHYQPPGFVDCTGSTVAKALLKCVSDDSKIESAGMANFGYYSISMKVASREEAKRKKSQTVEPLESQKKIKLDSENAGTSFSSPLKGNKKIATQPVFSEIQDKGENDYYEFNIESPLVDYNSQTPSQLKINQNIDTNLEKLIVKSIKTGNHDDIDSTQPMVNSKEKSNSPEIVKCICGKSNTALFDTIFCKSCSNLVHKCCQGFGDKNESEKFINCMKCKHSKFVRPANDTKMLEQLAKFRKLFTYITMKIKERKNSKKKTKNSLYFEQGYKKKWHDTAKLLGLTYEEILLFSQIMKTDKILVEIQEAQNYGNKKKEKTENESSENSVSNYIYNFSESSNVLEEYKDMLFTTKLGNNAYRKCVRRIERHSKMA